jgi:hypothetical protein
MLRQSSRPLLEVPASRGSYSMKNGAAGATAFSYADDQFTVQSSQLNDHMLRHHGRTERELNGLPLAELHRFEHVEQSMGLNDLGHQHPANMETHVHVYADPEEAPIPDVL